MNIFITDKCPVQSAKNLDNKRVVKMTLESAQMLATAIQLNGGKASYRISHKNHPATLWAAQTVGNYRWLLRHFCALSREYTRRYGKVHKCSEYIKEYVEGIQYIPKGELTAFVNCAANKSLGICYKHIEDVPTAYQMYLSDRWETDKREPKWN